MIDDDYLLMYLTDFLSVSSCCKLIKTSKRFHTPLITEYLQKRIVNEYKIVINGIEYNPTTIRSNWSIVYDLPKPLQYDDLEQLQIITPQWNFEVYVENSSLSYIWDFEKDGEHYVRTIKESSNQVWIDTNGKYEICRIRFSYSPPVYRTTPKTAKYMIYAAILFHYYSFWGKFETEGHFCMLWIFCLVEPFFFIEAKQQKLYRVINLKRRD
jgi:hypothetical protein